MLYTGITNSLERRVWENKKKMVPGFTQKYNCQWLVHFEMFDEVQQAIAREKQIKGWSRAKKNALVSSKNPEWRDLAAEWSGKKLRGPSPRCAAPPDHHPRLRWLRMTRGGQPSSAANKCVSPRSAREPVAPPFVIRILDAETYR